MMLDEKNIKQLRQNVNAILRSLQPDERLMQAAVEEAAREIAARYRSEAPASDIRRDVFATTGRYRRKPNLAAQLAGVRLRGLSRPWASNYREWRARAPYSRIRLKGKRGQKRAVAAGRVQAGQLVGMSLARMFEFGTKNIRRRPWARKAVLAGRYIFLRRMTEHIVAALKRNSQ